MLKPVKRKERLVCGLVIFEPLMRIRKGEAFSVGASSSSKTLKEGNQEGGMTLSMPSSTLTSR